MEGVFAHASAWVHVLTYLPTYLPTLIYKFILLDIMKIMGRALFDTAFLVMIM